MKNTIPRKIILELKYFQLSKYTKRLVETKLSYHELCTTLKPSEYGGNKETLRQMAEQRIYPCEVDINGGIKSYNYDLEVLFAPLDWFTLLNKFQVNASVYMVFYTIVGVCLVSIGVIIWVLNRALTKLRHPHDFMDIILRSYALVQHF